MAARSIVREKPGAFGRSEARGGAERRADLSRGEQAAALTSALSAWRSTGASVYRPWFLSKLATAYVSVGQSDEVSRCIAEASQQSMQLRKGGAKPRSIVSLAKSL